MCTCVSLYDWYQCAASFKSQFSQWSQPKVRLEEIAHNTWTLHVLKAESVSLCSHDRGNILGFPAPVNLGDKDKKADTETGTALVCKVSGRLIHKSTYTDTALVPWV